MERAAGRGNDAEAAAVLEHEFNADALHVLRKAVLACAMAAGMPESRATDVMLVAHELAANAVRYGGGRGRLSMWIAAGNNFTAMTGPGGSQVTASFALAVHP
jgi:hypothetical protein